MAWTDIWKRGYEVTETEIKGNKQANTRIGFENTNVLLLRLRLVILISEIINRK